MAFTKRPLLYNKRGRVNLRTVTASIGSAYFMSTASFILHAQEQEGSFKAPLASESVLLDYTLGSHHIVVGERGHVLLSDTQQSQLDKSSFTQTDVPSKVTLTAVYAIDNLAWAVGHDASILKSNDGGKTWEVKLSMPELDRPFLDVFFFDQNEGIAVGAYGLFYRSLDSGETWTQEQHPSVLSSDDKEYLESIKDDEAFYLEELSFISPHYNRIGYFNDIVYLAGEAGLVGLSSARGKNWERLELDYLGSFFDVSILPSGEVLAVGLRGNMFMYDSAQWKRLETCVTTSLNSVVGNEQSDALVLVTGNNGVLLQIDTQNLKSNDLSPENSEGCRSHAAISIVPTGFSDAILGGTFNDKTQTLTAVTTGGIKNLAVAN